MGVERRVFLGVVAVGGIGWAIGEWRRDPEARPSAFVAIAEFDDAGRPLGVRRVPSVFKTDAEWKKSLALDEYYMTRRSDTEFAYTGEYWNFHGDGLYRCVCCVAALFDSKAKYASGTGWPSFTEPIASENVTERGDISYGIRRTEVRCTLCGAHLGHVFDDGPGPSGRRYCVNSVSLRFQVRNFT